MIAHRRRALTFCAVLFLVFAILSFSAPFVAPESAQAPRPILFSNPDSTRAIVVDSITTTREPFSPTSPVSFGSDPSTRVMLFAGNLRLQDGESISAVTADAEDESHTLYSLSVEAVTPVPDQNWATAVIVKLNSQLVDSGDVLVRVYYHGVASNRVRV